MKNPVISIIVPVYNLEAYLNKCIDSILSQTFTDFELILINDGSTDKSGEICNEYAATDNRVKVVHKKYGGVSSARNIGLKNAKGEYIGFVDGDDWIFKDMFKTLYELCLKTNSDIAVCNLFREIDGQVQIVEREDFVKEMDNSQAMSELFRGILYRFALWNKLYKRSCFENVQFPNGRIHEDLSTTYRAFAKSKKVVYTNYTGYVYVKRSSSILNVQYNKGRLDAFLGWDEIIPYMRESYPEAISQVTSCFAYWCVDNVFMILNQVTNKKDRKHYLGRVQFYIRKYYKEIVKNNALSLKYKLILTLLNSNVGFFNLGLKMNHIYLGRK